MNIVVDENISYGQVLLSRLGKVTMLPGRLITKAHLMDAQALIIRSTTQVDSTLLATTPVRFVGSTTAGTDHIDVDGLQAQGIHCSAAPGCNAQAVVEYVLSVLLLLAKRGGFLLCEKTVGIVGVGHIGTLLNQRLQVLQVKTLLCDPPRADQGATGPFLPFAQLIRQANILTFHTPLEKESPYPTWHLVNDAVLAALPSGTILINTARGAVFDNAALLTALTRGKSLTVVLDVWENEPKVSWPLLAQVDIGTPHIAGYSLEGKARGSAMVYTALCNYLAHNDPVDVMAWLPKPERAVATLYGLPTETALRQLMRQVYDVRRDDDSFRSRSGQQDAFDHLRRFYPERREWGSLRVDCDNAATLQLLQRFGFQARLKRVSPASSL